MHRDDRSVAVFEPHPVGHAHFQYSSSLVRGLAACARDAFHVDFITVRGAPDDCTSHSTYWLHPIIDAPRPLKQYHYCALGVLDRCIHWCRADRQLLKWVANHPSTLGVHYQESYGFSTVCAVKSLRRRGVPAILTVHNIAPHTIRRFQNARLNEALRKRVYRAFDALIVHSESLQHSICNLLGHNTPPVYVIPHGIGEPLEPGDLRPLAVRMPEKRILFVGSPRPNKGLDVLIKAMKELTPFTLTVAGFHSLDGAREEALRTLANEIDNTNSRVFFMSGYISDRELDEAFRKHSAVILPYTQFSSQSGVLSRAVAYRTPVVVTDVGALGETVRRFQIGVVVPPGSSAEIAAGVHRLYEMDPNFLERNLDRIAMSFSWDNVAAATAEVYSRVFQLSDRCRSQADSAVMSK